MVGNWQLLVLVYSLDTPPIHLGLLLHRKDHAERRHSKRKQLDVQLSGFSSAVTGRARFVSVCSPSMPRRPTLQAGGTRQNASAIYHSCCFIVSRNWEAWFCKWLFLILDPL